MSKSELTMLECTKCGFTFVKNEEENELFLICPKCISHKVKILDHFESAN